MKIIQQEIHGLLNLYTSRNFIDAEKTANNLIKKYPNNAWLYNFLGLTLIEQKKFDEAISCYESGIKIDNTFAMFYNNLGTIYKAKKDYLKSENYYKKSIQLDQKIPEPENNLGNLYRLVNKDIEAINCYNNSIKKVSNFYPGHYNLGITYKSLGDFKNAETHLKKAINLNPNFYTAHRNLSEIIKYKKKTGHLKILKKIYKEREKDKSNKSELCFALAKAHEDLKDFDNSFKYYNLGNIYKRETINFSTLNVIDEFSKIKKIFNKKIISKFDLLGSKDKTPVFILGMPRSGTTLIEQILSSHPDVFGADEINILPDIIKKYISDNNDSISEELIKNLDNKKLLLLGNEYVNQIKKLSTKSINITDKLPVNFKWIGFIKMILPNCKIIHCTRNSKDTCLSIFKNYFVNNELNYAYNIDEIVAYYNEYLGLMKYWHEVLPNFIFDIRYENLLNNPTKEIKNLIKTTGLTWNNKCLKFYQNKRIIKTASDTQARKKLYKTSIKSWKNYEKYLKKSFTKLLN